MLLMAIEMVKKTELKQDLMQVYILLRAILTAFIISFNFTMVNWNGTY